MRVALIAGILLLAWEALAAVHGMPPRAPIQINFPDFPPYFFLNPEGQRTGITADTLTECLNAIKRPFVFVDLPIERMQISMQEGFIDIHTYSYNKTRESFVEYGHQELFRTEYRPVVRADSAIQISKVSDFDKLKLGHIIGLRYSPEFMIYVEGRRKNRSLDEAANTEQNLRKLLAARIDTFVNAVEPALYSANRLGFRSQVRVLDWVAHDGHYFTAVSKNSRRIPDRRIFLKEFDGCIRQMKKSGAFCAIYERYGLACPDLPNRT